MPITQRPRALTKFLSGIPAVDRLQDQLIAVLNPLLRNPSSSSSSSGGTPSGTAGGDLTGSYPNPTLATSGVTAATYGDSTHIPQIAVDAKGRITSASSVAIASAGEVDFMTRRFGAVVPIANGTTTPSTFWGIQSPTFTSTNGPRGQALFPYRLAYLASAAASNVAGWEGPFTESRVLYSNRLRGTLLFDGSASAKRIWMAISSASLLTTAPPTAAVASAIHFVGIAYDPAVSANWLVCSGDGTNMSGTDTGVAAAAGLTVPWWRWSLDWTNTASFVATLSTTAFANPDNFVQQFSTTKTTNLSTSAQAVGGCVGINATGGVPLSIYFGGMTWEQAS